MRRCARTRPGDKVRGDGLATVTGLVGEFEGYGEGESFVFGNVLGLFAHVRFGRGEDR
ncbi:hypothetical protein [Streptomyces sp. NBC_00986]|uniref:hypothetical protein n=1 Tax=Streptomyces sp. NBC_00986 TaxID=2903702 RepID=UPI0038686743|nr:hypothetical protein OG504_50040 [Streptomyces sp. NBC_00986]